MRKLRVLRSVASSESVGDVSTLEDEASVEEVQRAYEQPKRELYRAAPRRSCRCLND